MHLWVKWIDKPSRDKNTQEFLLFCDILYDLNSFEKVMQALIKPIEITVTPILHNSAHQIFKD